jgi:hypothetical protein
MINIAKESGNFMPYTVTVHKTTNFRRFPGLQAVSHSHTDNAPPPAAAPSPQCLMRKIGEKDWQESGIRLNLSR